MRGLASDAWEFAATGTRWRVHHGGTLKAAAARELAAAVRRDEARWSPERRDSELCALNRAAGRWHAVSFETFALVRACERFRVATAGVVNPLSGGVELDAEQCRVRLSPGGALELGGVGKAWIAQRLAALAARLSDDPGLLIDAGGDLLAVSGRHVVAVEDPEAPQGVPLCWLALEPGQAVATSRPGARHRLAGDAEESRDPFEAVAGSGAAPAQATVLAGDAVSAAVQARVLALRPGRIHVFALPGLVHVRGRAHASAAWGDALTAAPHPLRAA